MSLINDMLKDLDERGQAKPQFIGSDSVAPVAESPPAKKTARLSWRLVVLGLTLILAGGVLWFNLNQLSAFEERLTSIGLLSAQSARAHQAPKEQADAPAGKVAESEHFADLNVTEMKTSQLNDAKPVAPSNIKAQSYAAASQPPVDGEVVDKSQAIQQKSQVPVANEKAPETVTTTAEKALSTAQNKDAEIKPSKPLSLSEVRPSAVQQAQKTTSKAPPKTTLKPVKTNQPVTDAPDAQAQPVQVKAPVPARAEAPSTLAVEGGHVSVANTTAPLLSDAAAEKQAKYLLNQGQLGAAENLLKRTLNTSPQYLRSRVLLSGIYLTQGRNTEAKAQLELGLGQHPAEPSLLELKARGAISEQRWQDALTYLEQSNPSMNSHTTYYGLKASALQNLGRMEESAALYYALLDIDNTQAGYWVGLGYTLEHLGRVREAREAYLSSLKVPHSDSALRQFANARLSSLKP
ncbi:MAG: tetratricopeptide repeat protein [Pontibacterium sp.]